jgi:hypothetical protein
MESLVKSLAKVEKKPPFSLRKGFQSHPSSLREMMRIMNLPNPDIETLEYRMVFDFSEDNSQGIAYADGNTWFLSSEYIISQFVINGADLYNPTDWGCTKEVNLSNLIEATNLNPAEFNHIGAIDYFEGLLFAPIKCTTNEGHILLGLSKDLEVVGYSRLPTTASDSFCAINPWNRLLYMGIDSRTDCLQMYDVSRFYDIWRSRRNWGQSIPINLLNQEFHLFLKDGVTPRMRMAGEDIQGIAFSNNGRLYVTSWTPKTFLFGYVVAWHNYLHIYNTLTGALLGIKEYDFPGSSMEIEGLSIHPSGIIYVAVCDNDPNTDEFEIHAFKYQNPSFPV